MTTSLKLPYRLIYFGVTGVSAAAVHLIDSRNIHRLNH